MKKTFIIPGSQGRPMLADIQFEETAGKKPVIIYAHGFCGFKDWGNFDLIAQQFVKAGFAFLKFNFSHNGTTPENPDEFTDLEAFGQNNYSLEVNDLNMVINYIMSNKNEYLPYTDTGNIGLIGHSMGGGISILTAANSAEIKALATWASIAKCTTPWTNWSDEQIKVWEKDGVAYYHNGRTHQDLPLYFQLHEDLIQHKDELNILKAAKELNKPLLICHGTADTSVPLSEAKKIEEASGAELFMVDSNHVFGRSHPYELFILPVATQHVVDKCLLFFKENLGNKD